MDNNKNIIGEINTRGNFIEKSRTSIGGVYNNSFKKNKKINYDEDEDDSDESEVEESTMTYRPPKNNYELPFSNKLSTYILIAGIIIVLFTIIVIAL